MVAKAKSKAKKWAALIPGIFMMSALLVDGAPAQEKPDQQGRQQRQQQSRMQTDQSALSDDMLEDLLAIRLAERSNLTPVIKATVKDGVATISGKVPDEAAKRRALRIARSTKGISSVRDQIGIDPSLKRSVSETERKVSEKELVKQVAEKIAASIDGAKAGKDWWFEGWRVEGQYNTWSLVVEVDDPGFVVLEGDVPSLDLMRKAVEAAAQVPGVRAVDTDLRLDRHYHSAYPYYTYGNGYPYYTWGYPYYPPGFAPLAGYPLVTPSQDGKQAASGVEKKGEQRR